MLNRLALVAVLAGTAPALAQDTDPAPDTGGGLMQRGLQLFMDGLRQEMEPALEGLQEFGPEMMGFLREMGPALADLMEEIKDWSAYHPPEIRPNGDIILRRKTPQEMIAPQDPNAPIDL